MKLVRVAAAVINQTPLDWDGNRRRLSEILAEAREQSVSLLCLPEMCISGYGCEDAFLSSGVTDESLATLDQLLPETRDLVVAFGLPLLFRNALWNAVAVAVDGRLAGFVAKRHLAGDGVHYEPRWFKPWPAGERTVFTRDGQSFPLGDILFEIAGIRIGVEICEDAWVAERPGAGLAQEGADIILNPSASHFAFGKIDVRRRFVLEGSRAFGTVYLYANLVGNEAGRTIYDGGALLAAEGRMLAESRRFCYRDWEIASAAVDLDRPRLQKARTASFRPEISEPAGRVVRAAFSWREATPDREATGSVAKWESGPDRKQHEFARAITLGLFDYLRKSRANGFVVSLSGGADSSAVVCLISLMVKLALADLGAAGLAKKLAHIDGLARDSDPRAIVAQLLRTVYQATANSSETTRHAARIVAGMVGARHHEVDVEPLYRAYVQRAEAAIGRPLEWNRDDITLQNVQARVRAPMAWTLANLDGALLLATSNRSEAAVGYATMDGDTAGGLSPIAGIDKAFLRHWLEWLQTTGPDESGPYPELAVVTGQRSTPELRPSAAHQVSEDDLMPFNVLDEVERYAIRDKETPVDVWRRLSACHPEHDGQTLARWVERFFLLFCRNQWKRERYAPSFHLDDENLDPKSWCRFPILSGGYARELAELRKVVGASGSS